MKQNLSWHKPLAIFALTSLACLSLPGKEAKANLIAQINPRNTVIDLVIPPPQTPRARPVAPPSRVTSGSISIPVPPPASRVSRGICPNFLEPAISSVIDNPRFAKGRWGVLIESVDDRRTFYSRNANSLLVPASNIKLLTTAAALQRLDPTTSIRSKSLWQWLQETNQRSNNSYADVLLRYIGGTSAVKQALGQLGISPNGYRQVDGSGLSRQNLATPATLVSVLQAMSRNRERETFYKSLPIAGVSGTLRNRLRYSFTRGRVHAKTGTLRGVKSLSGYLEHPQYGTIVFSIMVNQGNQSGGTLAGAIDEIVLRTAQLTPCD